MYNIDSYRRSNSEIISEIGRRFRQYRIRMSMTQREVATHTGLSVTTIHKFETGSLSNISLKSLLALLRCVRALDIVDSILPELPPSPYLEMRDDKAIRRVRHKQPLQP